MADTYPKIMHGVHGLIGRGEANYLNSIGADMGEGIYIDLGTFRGRSAVCMADSFRKANLKDTKVWTLDTFDRRALSSRWSKDNLEPRRRGNLPRPESTKKAAMEVERIAEVQEVMDSRGLSDYVRIISSETTVVPKDLDRPVRFVFIDADHSYDGCMTDWFAWKDLVADDGAVAFHDSHLPGVAKTHELHLFGWEQIHAVQSITVWRRT
jgi:predicted O-methyltransferase YrrM